MMNSLRHLSLQLRQLQRFIEEKRQLSHHLNDFVLLGAPSFISLDLCLSSSYLRFLLPYPCSVPRISFHCSYPTFTRYRMMFSIQGNSFGGNDHILAI